MRSVFVSALAVIALATHATAAILNGSFESVAQAVPDRVNISSATSWTATGGSMLLERAVNTVSQITAQDGDQFVSMGHSGASNDTLSQVITTTPGEILDVSFFVACIQGNALQSILASAVDTSSNAVLGSVSASISSRTQGWIGYTFQFQPTGISTRISFVHDVAAGSANIALDNVTVTPAPSAAGLLGLAGVAATRRRRR